MNVKQMKGRDLAAERHRARLKQYLVAQRLGVPAPVLSRIENESRPTDAEFNRRYMDAVAELTAEPEVVE